jgi:hypothetical protein
MWQLKVFSDKSEALETVLVELTHTNLLFTYRIDQPNICSVDRLLKALQLCPLIERVCVISSKGKLAKESALQHFVYGAPKLVFLFIQLDTLTEAACKRFKRRISERYVSEQNLCTH